MTTGAPRTSTTTVPTAPAPTFRLPRDHDMHDTYVRRFVTVVAGRGGRGFRAKRGAPSSALVALLALLIAPLFVPVASAADAVFDPQGLLGPAWVGPLDASGWHFRVPVTVSPHLNGTGEGFGEVPVEGLDLPSWPTLVTLDLEALLGASHWLTDPDTGNLISFTLDTDSFRVVEVTGHARSHTAVTRRPALDGFDRYAVPHILYEGSMGSADVVPFDAATNPTVSLVFLVGQPEVAHSYHVYFDIEQNGQKAAPRFSQAELGELDRVWSRDHANVFLAPSVASDKPIGKRCVFVTAQHDGTQLTGTIGERIIVPGTAPEFTGSLERGETAKVLLGTKEPSQGIVRIAASKPVEAALVVDNENPTGSGATCEAGLLRDLGGVHAVPLGPAAGTTYHILPLSDRLGIARLAGDRVEVQVLSPAGVSHGVYTYDPSRARTRPGTVLSLPARETAEVRVTGSDDAVVALMSVGSGLVQGPTPSGRPADLSGAAPGGHDGQFVLVAPGRTSYASLEDSQSVLYQGNVTVPGGLDPIDAAPTRGFWSLVDGGKPMATTPVVAFARSLVGRPITLFSSVDNVADTTLSLFTPVAGEGARVFHVPVRDASLQIVPLFPATRVEVEGVSRAGITWTNRTLTPPASITLSRDGGYTVHATKPVGAYLVRSGTSSFGAVLPGRPLFLAASAERIDWGGYLVGITTSETSVLVPPGQEATVALDVHDHGQKISTAFLPDRATLEAACTTEACDWTVELAAKTVGFPSSRDSPQRVLLKITPPADAAPEDPPVDILVTATSLANPKMKHELVLGAGVRIRYGVLVTFDTATLLPDPRRAQVIEERETASYDLAVVNTGDVRDTMQLRVLEVGGFASRVVDAAGEEVASVVLDSGAKALLRLDVSAPTAESQFLTSFATLAATSTGDSFQISTVTAITSINPNVKVLLVPDEARKLAIPGEELSFNVTIVNLGDVSDVLRVTVEGSAPPGWEEARVEGLPLPDRVSVPPGRPVLVQVVTRPPEGAPPLSKYTMRISAIPQSTASGEGGSNRELVAEVDRHYALAVEGARVVLGSPQEALPAVLVVTNEGNADETYRLVARSLPPGWSLAPVAGTTLAEGASSEVIAELRFGAAPPAPGEYRVQLAFVPLSRPSAALAQTVEVSVFPFSGLELTLAQPLELAIPPGRTLGNALVVRNVGNQEALVDVEGTWGPQVKLAGLPLEVFVRPGESARLPVTLQIVPGTRAGELPLAFTATTVGAEATLDAPLATEPLNLRIVDPRLVETGDGALVQARILNRGNATAHNLTVTLEEAGEPLRNVTIATLIGGAQSPVSLIVQPGAREEDLALRLVGGEGQEATPNDNFIRLRERESGLPVPILAPILALVAGAFVGRRRVFAGAHGPTDPDLGGLPPQTPPSHRPHRVHGPPTTNAPANAREPVPSVRSVGDAGNQPDAALDGEADP